MYMLGNIQTFNSIQCDRGVLLFSIGRRNTYYGREVYEYDMLNSGYLDYDFISLGGW